MIRMWLLAAALCLLTMAAGAEPVAMIVRLSGTAEVNRRPARLLQRLDSGDVVSCLSGKVGIVMIIGGERFQLIAGQKGIVGARKIGGEATEVAGLRAPSLEASRKLEDSFAGAHPSRPALGDAADLSPAFKGWLPSGTHHFSWRRAKSETDLFQLSDRVKADPQLSPKYRFSLFDVKGNLLWSDVSTTDSIDCPGLVLKDQTPYIWRIELYNHDGSLYGRNSGGTAKWGFVSFLNRQQELDLMAATKDIQSSIHAEPSDSSLRALLAFTYIAHGVPMAAIDELLGIDGLDNMSTSTAREKIYSDTSSLAVFFAGFNVPEDRPKDGGKQ